MKKYNSKFKKAYKKMFKKNPVAANMMILFMDIADENGQFTLEGNKDEQADQLMMLMAARFNDVEEYQL